MPLPLPRWIAHRGGGRLAPENTLAGIRMAARLGFKAVEFDVMLSGDGTPVLIHDETLERTTNGAGRVCDTPDSVLFSLDAGHGERIPRFAEAAALCRELGLLANVEIKPAAGHELATAAVVSRQRLRAISLHCDADLLRDEVLAEARAHDIPVLCYTVNAPEQAEMLFARGVSGLFTDRLDLFAG